MAAPRGAAHDPLALLAEASWWRDTLSTEAGETVPLLIAWAAWRWADAARRLVAAGGRDRHTVAVITLLAHARIMLDLLDAGRLDAAVRYHQEATGGVEVLSIASLGDDPAFRAWTAGHSGGVRTWLGSWRHGRGR